jgi:hypothetical protein
MTEFNFSVWEKTLNSHFQTHRKRRIRQHVIFNLIINLEAVNSGLKPGFLWDVKEITMEHTQLLSLVADLKRNKLLHLGIFVVSIGDELIVADLRQVYISCSSDFSSCFIDVSPQLDAPAAVQKDTDVASDIYCMLEGVSQLIAEFLSIENDNNKPSESMNESNIEAMKCKLVPEPYISSSCKRDDKRRTSSTNNIHEMSGTGISNLCICDKEGRGQRLSMSHLKEPETSVIKTGVTEVFVAPVQGLKNEKKTYFILKTDKNWCVPTLLGVFLGYPVIYWYKQMSVRNDGETCLSFIPLTVFRINVEIGDIYPNQNRCCNLYSFSVPSDAVLHLENKVQLWFRNLMDIVKSQTGIFKNIKLMKEIVVLPSVVL